ncbi:hypothetical protein N9H75_04325, partial [Amylibacter sp.]|nr:hypothetical protein [Amylibacter sp.]
MSIRKFFKYYQLIILFLFPISIQAQENNYIFNDFDNSVVNKIDELFLKDSLIKNVVWTPKIYGKSRYSFSIPKDAYIISKKHADASDLYYLSNQIDNGISFQKKTTNSIEFYASKKNTKIIFKNSILSNTDLGFFLEKNEKHVGIILSQGFVISKNAFGEFGFKQEKDENTTLNARFVKLTKSENSELYGNISHKLKSNFLSIDVGYTFFDIANKFDFTVDINQNNDLLTSGINATIGSEKIKYQIG